MKHTYKEKIQILRSILVEYSKYFKYFDFCTCYMPKISMQFGWNKYYRNLIIKEDNETLCRPYKLNVPCFVIYYTNRTNGNRYKNLKRRIPITELGKIIKRYRSKLDYEIKKHNQTKNTIAKSYNFVYSIMNLK